MAILRSSHWCIVQRVGSGQFDRRQEGSSAAEGGQGIRGPEEAMKGVVFLGDRKLELREFPDPTPGPRDVVLEIKASGMCGSDLHNYRAPAHAPGTVTGGIKRQAGMIAGHEPCGVVVVMGARVIAIDVAPERRKLAQAFGAHEVIDPRSGDVVAAIRDLTHGEGAHKTLDASSAPDARAAAVRAVRSWGTACFVGERGQVTLDVSPDLLRRQVTLVGSWTFSRQGQAECAEFVADRNVDVEKLFTHRWKLEQAEDAYKLFDTQTTGKAVILPS